MASKKGKKIVGKPVSKTDALIEALKAVNMILMQRQLSLEYLVESMLANQWTQPGVSREIVERWSAGVVLGADKDLRKLVGEFLAKAQMYANERRPPGVSETETMQ